jgi:hypothetical protein
MTNWDALAYWKATLSAGSNYLTEPAREAVECAIDALRTAVEVENSAIDERKGRGSINVSTENKDGDSGDFRADMAELWNTLNWLTQKVRKLERELYGE